MLDLGSYGGLLTDGVAYTVRLTAVGMVVGSSLGLVLASLRMSRRRAARLAATWYVNIFVVTPVLVQLYWLYYVAPQALGLRLSEFVVVGLTLGLNAAAVLAENFRAGLQAVPAGQREAAWTLGLSPLQAFRHVVLPQAIRIVLPTMGSTTIATIKDSSIATFIGAGDLLNNGRIAAAGLFQPLAIFSLVALIYFALTYPISLLSLYLERRWRT